MSLFTILTISLVQAFAATDKPEDCSKYLRGANIYEELVGGNIVEKHSTFEIVDWSRNSAFELIVATKETPKDAEVVVEYKPKKAGKPRTTKGKLSKWDKDPEYMKADLDLEKLFPIDVKEGTFTMKVAQKGKVLCEEVKKVELSE